MSLIMMLYDKPSILLTSMVTQLKEKGYDLFESALSIDNVNKCENRPDLIFILADDDISDDIQAIVYIKDYAMEKDIPIMYAGDERENTALGTLIPKHIVISEYLRPIDVGKIVSDIHRYLSDENRVTLKKILVVDDSGAMLRNVKGWLENKYKVILANSGAMAIKYLSLEKPDLILLDYEMPVVNGKQVLEMIRTEVDFADVPVIFLTSKGDRESVMDVMSLKPEGYLLKTMPPEEIIKTIDEFFLKRTAEQVKLNV